MIILLQTTSVFRGVLRVVFTKRRKFRNLTQPGKEAAMAPQIRVVRVFVDYGLPFEKMVEAGRYDDVDLWAASLFAPTRIRSNGEIELHLLFYDRPPIATNGDLYRELAQLKKRAGETAEILALGALYPNFQREFPIGAFGSRDNQFNGGHARYPCLDSYEGKRRFGPIWDDPYTTWNNQGGAILAVPE